MAVVNRANCRPGYIGISGWALDSWFLPGPLAWTSQAVSQDFIDLVIALPVLVIGGLLAFRGSHHALLVWMGALSYLLYTFVIYAFDAYFNPLELHINR